MIAGSLLLFGCLRPSRAPSLAPVAVVTAEVRQERLPSGLSVVIETRVDTEVAGVALLVDAGAVREPLGKEGLAHWTEHLAFRGRHHDGASVERRLNALSASWNGSTSHDFVLYHAFAAKAELPKLVEIAADVMAEPLAGISDAVFEHERRIVEAERGFRSDHAPGQVEDFIYQSVFPPSHPYGRSVGGTPSSIAAWSAADARAFVAEHYRPSGMTLYVIAPHEAEARALVSKALSPELAGSAAARSTPPVLQAPSLQAPGKLTRRSAAIPAPELWLTWPLPVDTRRQRAQAEMLAEVVAIGARPSFESNRAIASGDCSLDRGKLMWLLNCRVSLNETNDLDATISHLLSELRITVANSPHRQDWFWRIKRRFVVERALAAEPLAARGVNLVLNARQYADPFEDGRLLEDVSKLEFSDIAKPTFELMRREQAYLTLIEPLPGSALAPAVPTGFATELATDDGQVVVETDVDLALASLPKRQLARTRVFKLSNGLTLLVYAQHTPFTTAVLGFRGGNSWLANPALARAASEAEIWGNIQPDPISAGIELRRSREQDVHWYSARSVGGTFADSLQVLSASKAAQIAWPSLDFRRRQPLLDRYDQSAENRAERELRRQLYRGHPYAGYAPPGELEAISPQSIHALFSSLHRPERAALVVVGDVDAGSVYQACEEELRDWRVAPAVEVALPPAQLRAPSSLVDVQHRPGSLESDFELSCLVPLRSIGDRAAAQVLAQVLNVMVWRQLRASTGAAYYAGANVELSAASAARVDVRTSVDNRHLDAALALFGRLLERRDTALPEGLFERARYDLIRGFAFEHATTRGIAFELLESWQLKESLTDVDALPRLIGAVTSDQTRALLDDCLGRAVLSAVGDQPSIEAALKAAGLSKRRSLD